MKSIVYSVLLALASVSAPAAIVTFSSQDPIFMLDGPSLPYPAAINITGLSDLILEVRVNFSGLDHRYPADIDALLVGPGGQSVMLMSDTAEPLPPMDPSVTDISLTFADGAPPIPAASRLTSGIYSPTNYLSLDEDFPEMPPFGIDPPPNGPYGNALSVFAGTEPNGQWRLYVLDDRDDDSGHGKLEHHGDYGPRTVLWGAIAGRRDNLCQKEKVAVGWSRFRLISDGSPAPWE